MKLTIPALTNATAAEAMALGLAALRSQDTLIDLSSVGRCDSSAVACVLAWVRCAKELGLEMRIAGVPDDLRSLLRLYRLESLLT